MMFCKFDILIKFSQLCEKNLEFNIFKNFISDGLKRSASNSEEPTEPVKKAKVEENLIKTEFDKDIKKTLQKLTREVRAIFFDFSFKFSMKFVSKDEKYRFSAVVLESCWVVST